MISGEQIALGYKVGEYGLAMLCTIAVLTILMVIGVNLHDRKQRKKTILPTAVKRSEISMKDFRELEAFYDGD